jgi:hypothetical protein
METKMITHAGVEITYISKGVNRGWAWGPTSRRRNGSLLGGRQWAPNKAEAIKRVGAMVARQLEDAEARIVRLELQRPPKSCDACGSSQNPLTDCSDEILGDTGWERLCADCYNTELEQAMEARENAS